MERTQQILLKVQSLETGYGRITALKGVSLELPAGQVRVVLGANGAGKSTLLRAIMGIIRPWRGTVEFPAGTNIGGLAAHRIAHLGIAYVPEGRAVFPGLTVSENLLMGGYVERNSSTLRGRLESIFERFSLLGDRRGQLAGTLSGGEQQMLAIARALMSSPKVILIDEPSLGLAPLMVDRIFQIVDEISKEGKSILLVEQRAREALVVSERAYVMELGRIVREEDSKSMARGDLEKAYLGELKPGAQY